MVVTRRHSLQPHMKRKADTSPQKSGQKKQRADADVESLQTLSRRALVNTLKSPVARHMAMSWDICDPTLQDAVHAAELSHIPRARGRIVEPESGQGVWASDGAHGVIDAAKFQAFDPHTRTVTIRIDHTMHPSFWVELSFPLEQLEEFCGREAAMYDPEA